MSKTRARSLLERQLKKHGLKAEELPGDPAQWQAFVQRVERAYAEYDEARLSSENILEVSLKEMERLQAEMSESNQKKVMEINENLSLVLSASELGTWDWKIPTNHVSFDRRWGEIIGLTPEQMPSTYEGFLAYLHPEDVPRIEEAVFLYMNGKTPKFEVRFRMKHAAGHWVDIWSKGKITSYDSSGKALRFMGTHLDTTEEQRRQREMEIQRVKLIQSGKMASLGELSAGVAHEINNPLAVIGCSLELLSEIPGLPAEAAGYVESVRRACERITRIVGGLKKFSRSDDKLMLKPHSLCEIVKDALVLTETKSKRTGTTISSEFDTDGVILCDEIAIEQVIINLVNNAIDAVKGRPEKWVNVSVHEEGESIVLRVTDSGPGIPEGIRDKLFQPFFTTKAVGEGTGLGLSITRGILEEHRATIAIDSGRPNTCFEIRFKRSGVKAVAA